MHIIIGPNGLVGPAAEHMCMCVCVLGACVYVHVCVFPHVSEPVALIAPLILGRRNGTRDGWQ